MKRWQLILERSAAENLSVIIVIPGMHVPITESIRPGRVSKSSTKEKGGERQEQRSGHHPPIL
jgi:hypothetical protein